MPGQGHDTATANKAGVNKLWILRQRVTVSTVVAKVEGSVDLGGDKNEGQRPSDVGMGEKGFSEDKTLQALRGEGAVITTVEALSAVKRQKNRVSNSNG